jgi:iron complex transport system substrate-binding protein
VFATFQQVAEAAGVPERADAVVAALRERVAAVARRAAGGPRPGVVLLEWLDPPFSCGHWSPELVGLAGGMELIGRPGTRSRTLSWAEVAAARPEVLVVACCGWTTERTRAEVPAALWEVGADRVFVADGAAYFSRPGPRLVDSLELLAYALAPDRHPHPTAAPAVRLTPA